MGFNYAKRGISGLLAMLLLGIFCIFPVSAEDTEYIIPDAPSAEEAIGLLHIYIRCSRCNQAFEVPKAEKYVQDMKMTVEQKENIMNGIPQIEAVFNLDIPAMMEDVLAANPGHALAKEGSMGGITAQHNQLLSFKLHYFNAQGSRVDGKYVLEYVKDGHWSFSSDNQYMNVTLYLTCSRKVLNLTLHDNAEDAKFKNVERGNYEVDNRVEIFSSDTNEVSFTIPAYENGVNMIQLLRDGYEYKGWSSTPSGKVEYVSGKTYTLPVTAADTTFDLYAVWAKPGETVEYAKESTEPAESKEPAESTEPAAPEEWKNPFTDVTAEDRETYEAIRYVYEKELFKGTSETTFSGTKQMERRMFVTVLGRLAGEKIGTLDHSVSAFTDVPKDAYYTGYVTWAAEMGIVQGNGDGTFNPAGLVTIEQSVALVQRFAEKFGYVIEQTTAGGTLPSGASEWAKEALTWGLKTGIVKAEEIADPREGATRNFVAVMLSRLGPLPE